MLYFMANISFSGGGFLNELTLQATLGGLLHDIGELARRMEVLTCVQHHHAFSHNRSLSPLVADV